MRAADAAILLYSCSDSASLLTAMSIHRQLAAVSESRVRVITKYEGEIRNRKGVQLCVRKTRAKVSKFAQDADV